LIQYNVIMLDIVHHEQGFRNTLAPTDTRGEYIYCVSLNACVKKIPIYDVLGGESTPFLVECH